MSTVRILSAAVAIAFAVSLVGAARVAHATSTISTPAGCNREFKSNKSTKASCNACVKGDGRFRKSGGSWRCEGGGASGGGGPSEDDKIRALKASKGFEAKPPPKKPKLNGFYAEYASVKPGTFAMGSPETEPDRTTDEKRTKITVTRGFKMKTTEVTQNEWYNVMGEHHYTYDAKCGWDCPVVEVSWHHVIAYLNALSKREKLEACYDTDVELPVWTKGLDCKGYRLPTEAEWELAARGGTTEPRYGDLDAIAWTSDNAEGTLHPVRGKAANAFGLFDMIGNTSEWVWDAWDFATPKSGSNDPVRSGDENVHAGSDRTIRGGNFYENKHRARSAARQAWAANSGGSYLGFRPVRSE
jgi:formylglycine-generating enzyme required for sulfatase activity